MLVPISPDGAAIRDAFLADERATLVALASQITQDDADDGRSPRRRAPGSRRCASERQTQGGVESFLQQYDLSTPEGVLLMCVAEALLRIPDAATADALIRDKLSRGDWERHLGASDSLLVNASTWGLMLTGKLTRIEQDDARDPSGWYERIVARAGEPVVRVARAPGDEGDGRAVRDGTHHRRGASRAAAQRRAARPTAIRTTCSAKRR